MRKGDRHVVMTGFIAIVQTHWFAPFTGGRDCKLPAGFELIVEADPPATATAVLARREAPKQWEAFLVDKRGSRARSMQGILW